MVRIVASLVVKNEADRYLKEFLKWNSQWWDDLFVFDDASSDSTRLICSGYGEVVRCHFSVNPFMRNEGEFRSAGWAAMEERMDLKEGDFVFSIDADEFLVGTNKGPDSIRDLLERLAVRLTEEGKNAANIDIPEVWDTCLPLSIRKDGLWTNKKLPRLTKYFRGGEFRNQAMACGSTPTYSYQNMLEGDFDVSLLHFGYAKEQDRIDRYDRYTSLVNHGHNPTHILSILSNPTTKKWVGGETPRLWQTSL